MNKKAEWLRIVLWGILLICGAVALGVYVVPELASVTLGIIQGG